VGKKPKNKFEETSMAFRQDSRFRLFTIELPSWVSITYRPMINGQLSIAVGTEDVPLPFSKKDEILEKMKALGHEIIEIKPSIMKVIDKCPKCERSGSPKIEKKDASDRRTRRPKHLGEIEKNKIYSKRPDEHWLIYEHNTKPKKCRIYQLESLESSKIKPSKRNNILMEKFVFPYALQYLKQ